MRVHRRPGYVLVSAGAHAGARLARLAVMKVPFNMTTPRLKLADGERVVLVHEGLRKKGMFGNRFGELYVTTHRVAFVKAIMKTGLDAVFDKVGARPILAFDRSAITSAERQPHKRLVALVITSNDHCERFVMRPDAIDQVLRAMS